MTNPCKKALEIQDASNLSGVLHAAAEFAQAVRKEIDLLGTACEDNPQFVRTDPQETPSCGLNAFRQHPALVLYANKLADMTGQFTDGVVYSYAYAACRAIVSIEDTHPESIREATEHILWDYYAQLARHYARREEQLAAHEGEADPQDRCNFNPED